MQTAAGPALFTPLTLRGVSLRNRIVVSPMAQYSAVRGMATDWHFAHFAKFALGGAGLVFTEATKPERRGLGTVADLGLWSDEHIPPLRRITDFLAAHGAVAGIQLMHAGRKAGVRRPWEGFGPLDRSVPVEGQEHWEVIGPSAVPFSETSPIPRAMGLNDIQDVIGAWVAATRRAVQAGFRVLEIHGAHGYLVHQFLSAEANRRTDAYGGSLRNRMRFALELAEAVRAAWPDPNPLFYRTSAVDEAGWSLEDTVALSIELKKLGVDAIDCSSGGITVRSTTLKPMVGLGYQVPYAAEVRKSAKIPTVAVGLIVDANQAERILQDGHADSIAMGRQLVYDPFWPMHAAQELNVEEPYACLPTGYRWWLEKRDAAGFAALRADRGAR